MMEHTALEPTNPYAATKAAAEYIVKAYRRSFNLPTIISRGNNVYGPRQYPEKLIPKFISLLEKGKRCPVYGDGSNLRSFLYVQDVAEAFEKILTKGKLGEIYNIGTSHELSTLQVLDHLLKSYGLEEQKEQFLEFVEDRPFNDIRYWIDTSKLEQLGWKPKVSFADGISRTIDWYRMNPNHFGNVDNALNAHAQLSQLDRTFSLHSPIANESNQLEFRF
jgi:dTDP-glucose 4,6-dehydratase